MLLTGGELIAPDIVLHPATFAARSINWIKRVLFNSAYGAYPVRGKVLELGALLYAVIGIALGGIIDITAYAAFVFLHLLLR
jgi:hypothetical protein